MARSITTPDHLADIVEDRYLWLSVGHLHRFAFQNLDATIKLLKTRGWVQLSAPRLKSEILIAPCCPLASAVFGLGSCLRRSEATMYELRGDCSDLFRAVTQMIRVRLPRVP